MGRHPDRSVYALPRCLVRRRRGQGVDEEVGAEYPGARVSRCREGRDADVTDPQITPELVQEHNLTPDEYARIVAMLGDRKSTRLNSSHTVISYAVFCLKKKKLKKKTSRYRQNGLLRHYIKRRYVLGYTSRDILLRIRDFVVVRRPRRGLSCPP